MKKMKKAMSAILAAAMVMSMGMTAMADEKPLATKAATYSTDAALLKKAYAVAGATTVGEKEKAGYVDGTKIYPNETLKFESVADTNNPDKGVLNLTIADLVVKGNADQKISISVPSYSVAGTYHYTISETAGDKAGVTYSKETLKISVLVTYDYKDSDNDGYRMTATVGVTQPEKGNKDFEFNNTYDLGSLDVKKSVTGNLGDKNKEFDVYVTFTSSNAIASDITYVDSNEIKTITAADVNSDGATVKITLKDAETVKFYNIPAGVTYSVKESDEYSKDTNKNGVNGYDAPTYTYGNETKTIAKDKTDEVNVINKKETGVDTGISLDNMPYFMVLAMVALGLVGFVSKKRSNEF